MTEYQKAWYLENKEAIAARRKIYYAENKVKLLAASRSHYNANKERKAETVRKWRERNPEKVKQISSKWCLDHKEKICEATTKWKKRNPGKVSAAKKAQYQRYKKDPAFVLSGRISNALRYSLKGGAKAGRHWQELVDFTIDQLKRHLEKLFKPGMAWENYGTVWHIDHKTPIAAFNFERPEDIDFRLCWSLKNLQPLEASKNMSKGAKLEKPFQPSLAIGAG